MREIQIIKAKTKQDCLICDAMMLKLMQFESKIDDSIFAKTKIAGLHEKALKQGNTFIAYAKADKPIGYIYGFLKNQKGQGTTTNRVFVDSLFIEEEQRNNGVGKMLLKALESWAQERFGSDYEIELLCLTNNNKALEFYKNLGYFEVKKTLRKKS